MGKKTILKIAMGALVAQGFLKVMDLMTFSKGRTRISQISTKNSREFVKFVSRFLALLDFKKALLVAWISEIYPNL